MSSTSPDPHSAPYLTDTRDSWWNTDFLELLSRRAKLAGARDVLDVGSGKGHFSRTIQRLLPNARLTGVDREPQWVTEATAANERAGLAITYVQGSAEALPFRDAAFDVVTCQTLLMHVADPVVVLKEMARVLRPGGRVLAVEPNNIASNLAPLVYDPRFDLEDVLAFVRLDMLCEKGKHALGLGYNSLGEGLAPALIAAGFKGVEAWMNDRCQVYLPPHNDGARAMLEEERALFDGGALIWPEDETRRYYLAGGGEESAFANLWLRARRAFATKLSMSHAANEGGLVFVVTGTKR